MTSSSTSGHSGGWRWGGRATRPEAHVFDIPAAAVVDDDDDDDDDDSSGDDPEDEEGEDWLGNHNLGEYRAAWQRGETDTIRSIGSTAAAAEEEEEEEGGLSGATEPHVAMGAASAGSAAAGDVVVQVGDLLSLPFSA